MQYSILPQTNIKISKICLGTMTWGEQNSEVEAHEQMDYAFSQGIQFFDTAEVYPVPIKSSTSGRTELFIGNWMKKNNNRHQIILATKIAGTGNATAHIRTTGFSAKAIQEAVEGSLKRLQTDYIDLYQLHWPERKTNFFGKLNYTHDEYDTWKDNFLDILDTLSHLVKMGKIRYIGISNETPWGTMRYVEETRKHKHLAPIITIQNPYSLLNRSFELGNAEVAHREHIGLLAYSPLGFGVLSGKYLGGKTLPNSRLSLFPQFNRYSSENAQKAVEKYAVLAKRFHLSLTHLSLAWVNSRSFLTSNIIGATTMQQLKENIASIDVKLNEDIFSEIEKIHSEFTIPSP